MFRELFHARRWHARFQAPMTVTANCGFVYVGDFVQFEIGALGSVIGKVLKFFHKVSYV